MGKPHFFLLFVLCAVESPLIHLYLNTLLDCVFFLVPLFVTFEVLGICESL